MKRRNQEVIHQEVGEEFPYERYSDMVDENTTIIRPQEGPQTHFVATDAEVAIYGGQAGGGKSWALMYIPLAYKDVQGFEGIIFRKTSSEIKKAGSLWDKSFELYGLIDSAEPRVSDIQWRFHEDEFKKKVVSKVSFAYMEHEKDKYNFQGTEVPYIAFDELTHFTKSQFLYLFSRNRSMTGIPGIIRATCNPDPDSFVADLISWYIDKDGYAIKERSGVIRYMLTDKGEQYQYNTMEELTAVWGKQYQEEADEQGIPVQELLRKEYVKTFTFIHASLDDNKILLKKQPGYKASLNALSYIDQKRLKEGNWKIKSGAGSYFREEDFEIVDAPPANKVNTVRFWDRAATAESKKNPDPDWTVGLKMSLAENGFYYIEHVLRLRENPGRVKEAIKNTASSDSVQVAVYLEQEPGASGVSEVNDLIRYLAGYMAYKVPKRKNTEALVRPVSSQSIAGNVKIVRGDWNKEFLMEICNYPDVSHDDQVVALIGAFTNLTNNKRRRAW